MVVITRERVCGGYNQGESVWMLKQGRECVVELISREGMCGGYSQRREKEYVEVIAREGVFSMSFYILILSHHVFLCFRGQNALHVLAQYSKDNGAAIFDLFLECMPKYPMDKPDANGNTGNNLRCEDV